MSSTAAFEPVTVNRLAEGASTFDAIKKLLSNPVEVYSRQMYREHFFESDFLGRRVVYTSDPTTFQDVLLTHQSAFPKGQIEHRMLSGATGNGLLTAEGRDWRTQRKASAPAFRHDRLNDLLASMNEAARKASARLADIGRGALISGPTSSPASGDVLPVMIDATFEIIAGALLSGEEQSFDAARIADDVALFLENLGRIDVLDFIPGLRDLPRPWGGKGRAAVERLRADAIAAVKARRESGVARADLLNLLLEAKDPDTGAGLSDTELRDNIITFIGAGHETTSLALTWALYLLANAPEWQERLAQEAHLVCGEGDVEPEHLAQLETHEWVIKEAMRLYPPAPTMARVASRDVEMNNLHMKKGDQIILAIYPMHRHEKLWDEPESFDPERFSPERSASHHRYQYIPFSGGPRICIGMRFAMMEAVTILAHVMRRVTVAPVAGFTPYPKSRITLRPEGGMRLVCTKRKG